MLKKFDCKHHFNIQHLTVINITTKSFLYFCLNEFEICRSYNYTIVVHCTCGTKLTGSYLWTCKGQMVTLIVMLIRPLTLQSSAMAALVDL